MGTRSECVPVLQEGGSHGAIVIIRETRRRVLRSGRPVRLDGLGCCVFGRTMSAGGAFLRGGGGRHAGMVRGCHHLREKGYNIGRLEDAVKKVMRMMMIQ